MVRATFCPVVRASGVLSQIAGPLALTGFYLDV